MLFLLQVQLGSVVFSLSSMISSASRHFGVWLQLAVRDSIIIGVSAGCVFLLAVAFIGSLIYRPVELKSTGKGSPYSIAERRVPELIPVLGSQPAGDVNLNPAVGYHYFSPGLQLPSQPLRGLLPISLLGEQRHDECEQFA